jgi:predicted lipoprotein with Yx(FWY)xxD motif
MSWRWSLLVVMVLGILGPIGIAQAQESAGPLKVGQQSWSGTIVTDISGRSVYTFTLDSAGQSACVAACAESWPPVVVDAGTHESLSSLSLSGQGLGSIARDDGSWQVTLQGLPLYRSMLDTQPGETLGNARDEFGGSWAVVAIQ